ncbi:MAG TPA: EAL domain-containing protein [Jatrophihabitans sp.]|nr:EAL domain-containing protein [Jatrophihabitans sp.]
MHSVHGTGTPHGGAASRGLGELVLDGLVDRLPAAVYVAESGATGRWLYASPQIEQILGYRADELIADSGLWARLLHPADAERVLRAEELGPRTGRTQSEYRMVRRDGQVVWVLDDALVAEVESYGVVQHGLLYEITERKRTELLLAEHADILERVARSESVMLSLLELARATEAISGAGRCVIALTGVDSSQTLLTSTGELSVAEVGRLGPARFEAAISASDGAVLGTVSLHYPPPAVVQELDQDLAGWAAGLATVTVVRAAEHASANTSMSLLEATLESTADGILVVNSAGEVLGYNQKMVDMWQLDPEVLKAGRDEELRAAVLGQLVEPHTFTAGVDRMLATPLASSHDALEFLDGRYYERYSQPQVVDGKPVGRVWSFRDMTAHRQLEQELRAQAFTDPLTPLPNRTYFIQQLTSALASASTPQASIAVLLLDLDDFKTVNDSLGHIFGDALLIAVAERLQGCLRSGDVAARLSGDEFVVLLDRLSEPEDAEYAAERLLAALSRPLLVEGQSLTVRASIGIAMPVGEESASELLRNADLAMYTAKRDGGGRCSRYAPPMHAEAVARLALKADLERALDNDELIVHYQPVIDLETFDIVSVEALVRWPHPERGLIPPADFIPLAEESRLIDRLGSAVLRQACAQVAQWRRTIPSRQRLTVSVNLSPRQLSEENLVADVRQALWVAGLPASALVLEITETSLASPHVDVVTVLNQLKGIGVALALDDFGVGYSSLGHLVNFPLDSVKIDKSFVERIGGDPSGSALLRAVLQVADALSLAATVEGIEEQAQLNQVRALGCLHAQGFLLSPPMDAAAVSVLLRQQPTVRRIAVR